MEEKEYNPSKWHAEGVVSKGEYNYIICFQHPNAIPRNGYVLEHRFLKEKEIGRVLNSDEVVHHIDGNKKNNSLDNLVVMTQNEHARLHQYLRGKNMVELRCPQCGKIFQLAKNQSFLVKKNKYNCNCCSKECKGKFGRSITLNGITEEQKKAIDNNLIREYKYFLYDDKKTY